MKGQIDYLLGNGPQGSPIINGAPGSLVVGYGNNSPNMPHHKAASCPASGFCGWDNLNSQSPNPFTLYGALIGGPQSATDTFQNDRGNYVTNEVALDYNCGFQGMFD